MTKYTKNRKKKKKNIEAIRNESDSAISCDLKLDMASRRLPSPLLFPQLVDGKVVPLLPSVTKTPQRVLLHSSLVKVANHTKSFGPHLLPGKYELARPSRQ